MVGHFRPPLFPSSKKHLYHLSVGARRRVTHDMSVVHVWGAVGLLCIEEREQVPAVFPLLANVFWKVF